MKQHGLKSHASGQRSIRVEPHGMVQPIRHNLVHRKQDSSDHTTWYTKAISIGPRGMVHPIAVAMTKIKWQRPSVHLAPHRIAFCLQTLEGIWNNYVDIEQKVTQVIFIIFLSTCRYNSLSDSTRQHEVWKKILLQADPIERLTVCVRRRTQNKTQLFNISDQISRENDQIEMAQRIWLWLSGRLD